MIDLTRCNPSEWEIQRKADREASRRHILCRECGVLVKLKNGFVPPHRTSFGSICRGDKATRANPALMLVTGNPPTSEVEKAWCRFHQRERYDGTTRNVGSIPGAPAYAMALGRLEEIDLGSGPQGFTKRPWVAYAPDDKSLWIVADEPMSLGGAAGRSVVSLTYDPMRTSGKEPAYYKHEFSRPLPVLTPIGAARGCRAAILDGGRYSVRDWVYD